MSKKDVKREGAIKKTHKKRAARRKKRAGAFFLAFMFVLLCVGAVLSVTILFPVKNITVDGDSVYSKQEIISASAITEEDNLIALSSKSVISRISKNLAKSGEITIKKVFPDTVKITVNNAVPKYYLSADECFYVLDTNKKIIEAVYETPADCMYISCTDPKGLNVGNTFSLSESDQAVFDKITALAAEKGLNVTGIKLGDRLDIKMTVDNKILVDFGSDSDIERKMIHFAAMYEKLSDDAQGIANLTLWTSDNTTATFRDVKIDVLNFCEFKTADENI